MHFLFHSKDSVVLGFCGIYIFFTKQNQTTLANGNNAKEKIMIMWKNAPNKKKNERKKEHQQQ